MQWGHERHRPYVNLIRDWVNSADPDGEWEVTKLLAVRGPPERRFWLIEWGHQLTDAVAGATDTGGFESGYSSQGVPFYHSIFVQLCAQTRPARTILGVS